jgi:UDP-N-acetylglucosamine--N-acetylmuramyl-(pentapeptide) pyrophosphoryl-undecaprenol N-acetylglucosamine transferase
LRQLGRGFLAARRVLRDFRPDVLFFTGGYVAMPVALAGLRIPTAIYVPDIEPALALKTLARFADRIAVTADESHEFFSNRRKVLVTGYPTRTTLAAWDRQQAFQFFGFTAEMPVLLVTGGSLGSLSINQALSAILPELLAEMQVIHLTGSRTWPQFEGRRDQLPAELAARYRAYPYLHEEMGAAFSIADLVVSRAGASSLGEYPYFGLPAILVPYPHAWRYQKVNAEYLARRAAALIIADADLPQHLLPQVRALLADRQRLAQMQAAARALAQPQAARQIADLLIELAGAKNERGHNYG